jgi:hypothetical protein
MAKKLKLHGKNKDMVKYSLCCFIVCLIISLLFMIIQKYAFGNDKPFDFINM